jgi:hypothetical protein
MSELLKRSIETLSVVVNVPNGLAHPFDEARAKELFKALHAEGESLTYDAVRKLALENQWPERHADALAELAQRIGAGGRVIIKNPREWGEPTVARLKKEISADKP